MEFFFQAIDGIEYRAISEARNKKDAQVNTSSVREHYFSPLQLIVPASNYHETHLDSLCLGFL